VVGLGLVVPTETTGVDAGGAAWLLLTGGRAADPGADAEGGTTAPGVDAGGGTTTPGVDAGSATWLLLTGGRAAEPGVETGGGMTGGDTGVVCGPGAGADGIEMAYVVVLTIGIVRVVGVLTETTVEPEGTTAGVGQ
jgi:hypothetical protein